MTYLATTVSYVFSFKYLHIYNLHQPFKVISQNNILIYSCIINKKPVNHPNNHSNKHSINHLYYINEYKLLISFTHSDENSTLHWNWTRFSCSRVQRRANHSEATDWPVMRIRRSSASWRISGYLRNTNVSVEIR